MTNLSTLPRLTLLLSGCPSQFLTFTSTSKPAQGWALPSNKLTSTRHNNDHPRTPLSLALNCLNTLIDQGYEFPEAVYKTLQALAVKQDELVSAYDSQA